MTPKANPLYLSFRPEKSGLFFLPEPPAFARSGRYSQFIHILYTFYLQINFMKPIDKFPQV